VLVVETFKPKVRDDLSVVELDGEAVVYDPLSGDIHHLNPSATTVFSLLDGRATVSESARVIADAYRVELSEVEPEFRVILRRFESAGLIENPASTQ
jgi:PqqD family protein of HPr-rel-A system